LEDNHFCDGGSKERSEIEEKEKERQFYYTTFTDICSFPKCSHVCLLFIPEMHKLSAILKYARCILTCSPSLGFNSNNFNS
jgi:hypothetical protein